MSVIHTWGSTAAERAEEFACDRQLAPPYATLFRAVDVRAPIELTYRWLCQLRAAPYSYDYLDNFGRRSPRTRDPKNERLAVGQRVMRIFRLADFEQNRHLTLVLDATKLFGELACSYTVRLAPDGSRIVVKLVCRLPRSPLRWVLPAGDLIMMRKQLLTLKALAEREHSTAGGPSLACGGKPA